MSALICFNISKFLLCHNYTLKHTVEKNEILSTHAWKDDKDENIMDVGVFMKDKPVTLYHTRINK